MNHLLKSPFHWLLSKRIMTVVYLGRKSGAQYEVPVSYYRDGGVIYCFTNGRWRHNFHHPRAVKLRVRGEQLNGIAHIDPAEIVNQREIMARYFRAVPSDRKFYGIRLDKSGSPRKEDVALAVRMVEMIGISLSNTGANVQNR
jgi:hypothetical protein